MQKPVETAVNATDYLVSLGLPGLAILALAAVTVILFKAYQKAVDNRIKAEQSRTTDAKEQTAAREKLLTDVVGVVARNTAALDKNADIMAKVVEQAKKRKGDPP